MVALSHALYTGIRADDHELRSGSTPALLLLAPNVVIEARVRRRSA
jgi:hypothetical protein